MSLPASAFPSNPSARITKPRIKHKWQGSPFDVTECNPFLPVGEHRPATEKDIDHWAFTCTVPTEKKSVGSGMKGHTGMGGTMRPSPAAKETFKTHTPSFKVSQRATERRSNPPNTLFRRYLERGDLPLIVEHGSSGPRPGWKVEVTKLDYHHYLPLFFDGLRELEEPYASIALKGATDMLRVGGSKILPVVAQLILPLKQCLNTRDPEVMRKALLILQDLVKSADLIGEALVPYYRQLLPVMGVYKTKDRNLGDKIDYSQRKQLNMGALVTDTLTLLETYGGPDAYINIRYMIPTWESVVYN